MSGTYRIGDVEYGEVAFEFMRELYGKAQQLTIDGAVELDPAIVNEAKVIHEIHRVFPGVVMKDDRGR